MQLMLQLRQLLMRLQHCVPQLLIDIAALLAGSLGLVAEVFQLIHALDDLLIVLRALQLLPSLRRLLVQLLDAILQVHRHAIAGAACVGALFAVVALAIPLPSASMAYRIETAWWWCGYLIMFAVLTGTLRSLLDREHDRAVQARAEALSEHLTIVEERDLRARLLEAQAMRDDGLRIVLHEFRTPISSLSSLANSLATPGRFETP